jgi:hypothetical protein
MQSRPYPGVHNIKAINAAAQLRLEELIGICRRLTQVMAKAKET